MVDKFFLQLDNPFDVGLENSTADREEEKKGLYLSFNAQRQPLKTHRDASAQLLLIVLQTISSAGKARESFSKEQEKSSINSDQPNQKSGFMFSPTETPSDFN